MRYTLEVGNKQTGAMNHPTLKKRSEVKTEYAIKFYRGIGDPGSYVKWVKSGSGFALLPVPTYREAAKYSSVSSADFSVFRTPELKQSAGVSAIIIVTD